MKAEAARVWRAAAADGRGTVWCVESPAPGCRIEDRDIEHSLCRLFSHLGEAVRAVRVSTDMTKHCGG